MKFSLGLLLSLFFCSYALAQIPIELPTIELEEETERKGKAADGYVVDNATNFGPWGDKKIAEIPATVTIIPSEMIENRIARNSEEVFKLNPIVHTRDAFDINNITEMTARGFSTKRAYIKGVQTDSLGLGVFIEDVEDVEILSGLSGFMYGAGNLGGVANFNIKRPSRTTDIQLILGDHGGGQHYAHIDTSIAHKIFALRLNIMGQDGKTPVKEQTLLRELYSGAIDLNIKKNLLLQFNASYGAYYLDGRQTQFWTGSPNMPGMLSPLDGSKLYGPKGTFNNVKTAVLGSDVKYSLTSFITLRTSYLHKEDVRSMFYTTVAEIVDNNSAYEYSLMAEKDKYITDGGFAYLDASFSTLGIKHKVTAGINGYYQTIYRGVFDNPAGAINTGYVNYPRTNPYKFPISTYTADYVPVPDWGVDDAPVQRSAYYYNTNFIIGDDIAITDSISLLAGLNQAVINQRNYHPVYGSFSSNYTKKALTPTVSLTVKPTSIVTVYASFMQALERGEIVPAVYKNGGETLEPIISNQYELGVKADLYGVIGSLSYFYIHKPNQYSDDGTLSGEWVQDGRQLHKGIELSLQGRLLDSINILAGGTYFNANIERSNRKELEGNIPIYVPTALAKLYVEYDTPIEGFTVSGGLFYTGSSYADDLNRNELPAYTTGDIGVRYTFYATDNVETRFMLNISNLNDVKYWAGQTIGTPRTLSFAVAMNY